MRQLIHRLWACLGLQAPDCMGPPFTACIAPLCRPFMHQSWSLSHRASHALEQQALAAAASPTGVTALKMLYRLRLLLLTGALLSIIMHFLEDLCSLISSTPRTARVVRWAVRAALSYRALRSRHTDLSSETYVEQLGQLHSKWAAELASVCRANGGIYVKCGQFAVSFGAVPREYRVTLSQLEDKATPRPFRVIRQVLSSELGLRGATPMVGDPASGALFREFEEEATAAASLAQVHRARLACGQEVAVKLQYPGLQRAVRADLSIIKMICRVTKTIFPDFSLAWLYDEMEAKLKIELNFRNEIHNSVTMREVLLGRYIQASVPKIFENLSTEHMIIMEWVQGIKLTDVKELRCRGINPHAVGVTLVKLFAELIFLHGYVHGDPHPGNLMVVPRGRRSWLQRLLRGSSQGFEIVLLDHGTYLTITPPLREQFCQLWCSFITRDEGVQSDLSVAVAGKRFEKILPAMLTSSATNRTEELALQKKYGVKGFGSMTLMLSLIPRDLMELLRINTVIRSSSSLLGIKMGERKRIFAWYARRGMPRADASGDHIHPSSRNLMYRLRLVLMLYVWTCWCWTQALFQSPWA